MQYIGSFIALVTPYRIFAQAVQGRALVPGIISNILLGGVWLYIGHLALSGTTNNVTTQFIPLIALLMPVATMIGVVALNFIFQGITVDGEKLGSNYSSLLLAELHAFPNVYALMYLWAAVLFAGDPFWLFVGVLLTLRFLEQQARVVQAVYQKTLTQAYVVTGLVTAIIIGAMFIFSLLGL